MWSFVTSPPLILRDLRTLWGFNYLMLLIVDNSVFMLKSSKIRILLKPNICILQMPSSSSQYINPNSVSGKKGAYHGLKHDIWGERGWEEKGGERVWEEKGGGEKGGGLSWEERRATNTLTIWLIICLQNSWVGTKHNHSCGNYTLCNSCWWWRQILGKQ